MKCGQTKDPNHSLSLSSDNYPHLQNVLDIQNTTHYKSQIIKHSTLLKTKHYILGQIISTASVMKLSRDRFVWLTEELHVFNSWSWFEGYNKATRRFFQFIQMKYDHVKADVQTWVQTSR